MKIRFEVDMTPEEARKVMGLPDVSALQEKMLGEMERRMMAAMNTADPEAMMRAWMPMGGQMMGGQAFEQFQKFIWDSAKVAAGGTGPKKETK